MRRLNYFRMRRKTEIIIGAKIQDGSATDFYFGALRTFNDPFRFIKARGLYFFHFFCYTLNKFFIHDSYLREQIYYSPKSSLKGILAFYPEKQPGHQILTGLLSKRF